MSEQAFIESESITINVEKSVDPPPGQEDGRLFLTVLFNGVDVTNEAEVTITGLPA